MKISEVKLNLQKIMTNLNQLQAYRESLAKDDSTREVTDMASCRRSLEDAFAQLETEPLQRLVAELKQRKARRRAKKLKTKKNFKKSSTLCSPSRIKPVPEFQPFTTLRKKELRSAKKYISFMDSLETLHHLKGGRDSCKLKESLSQIRSIWQSTAQKITEEQTNSIESQWDQVLFGRKSEVDIKCGMRDFIERRSIWDSYLVSEDDPSGCHIPIGWVCPKEDARLEWKQFQQPS